MQDVVFSQVGLIDIVAQLFYACCICLIECIVCFSGAYAAYIKFAAWHEGDVVDLLACSAQTAHDAAQCLSLLDYAGVDAKGIDG